MCDDDFDFLIKAAQANKAKEAAADAHLQIPDSVFKDLGTAPMELYPNGDFPQARLLEYNEHVGHRVKNDKQAKRLEALEKHLPYLREGGLVHKKVRDWANENGIIREGAKLFDICAQIEEGVRRLVHYSPPTRSLAFPCGCSINHCAAHYTPITADDETILGHSDVMKIDFGVNVNGWIIDSAYSVCFDPRFEPLIQASMDATMASIKAAGPDALLDEVGAAAEEAMCSYQLELDGKIYPIRPVQNLCGHQLDEYVIHAGNMVPIHKPIPGHESPDRMEIGQLYAIETFATTGNGIVTDDGPPSHFMVNRRAPPVKAGSGRDLVNKLKENYKTLAFTQRFIERDGNHKFDLVLKNLVKLKAVNPYPPLSDIPGSYVSQHEHTIALLPHGKEILSQP